MKMFLDYLYATLGLDYEMFDKIYEAAKAGPPSDWRTEIMKWYADNVGDDEDD